jgi:acyl-coenzyme A synthetase/AMP-(fatty) acid ligase
MDMLLARKQQAGAHYPPNIRFEPSIPKTAYKKIPKVTREELKDLARER